jgi:hypothetical protein
MSTRYLKKDNVILVGVAKNGSQTMKQIGLNNKGFEIIPEGEKDIDFYDSSLLILFPIRNHTEKALSEMLEVALDGVNLGKQFRPRYDYFNNDVMKHFVENILFNENWKGCKVRFFDLTKLSTHIPKYLGWDIEIPHSNAAKDEPKKQILRKKMKDNVQLIIPEINRTFFNGIKKSKYWINL